MCLGIPSQIVEISDATQMRAKVDVDGVRSEVSVALLGLEGPEAARVGDWVLVHVGFAIERISEEEARATLEGLAQLRDMYEQELPDTLKVSKHHRSKISSPVGKACSHDRACAHTSSQPWSRTPSDRRA